MTFVTLITKSSKGALQTLKTLVLQVWVDNDEQEETLAMVVSTGVKHCAHHVPYVYATFVIFKTPQQKAAKLIW